MTPVYLVLGAAGGIGSTLCRQLSASGASLALAGRNANSLQELGDELDGSVHVVDATSIDEVQSVVEDVVEQHGRLDGIVNCIGSILLKPAHRTSTLDWRRTIASNLDTAFATVRAGTSAMLRTGGSIVLISSAAARLGLPNHEAIAAAKAGVEGLALSAAASYARRGIRVNVVSPGLVRTPLSEPLTNSPATEKASIAMHALGRLGEPEDVASAIAWLLDPRQSWVTGQVIGVDGGLGSLRS
ncbi:MAG: NAD(P)-dependent dehydrogenase (short-subunit alcohol dehydrogenase family) [Planctomycetota bacterium]|jgi:NAD(P)-dependent dehydrogenase (short-subunit alcohol dehydrogenase family)